MQFTHLIAGIYLYVSANKKCALAVKSIPNSQAIYEEVHEIQKYEALEATIEKIQLKSKDCAVFTTFTITEMPTLKRGACGMSSVRYKNGADDFFSVGRNIIKS